MKIPDVFSSIFGKVTDDWVEQALHVFLHCSLYIKISQRFLSLAV